ncbi:MAG: MFS transporter [Alphaproteobacteria bacterium]
MKLPIVYTAVFAMLLQQALSTMSGLTIPVLAPPIAAETGLSPSLVGLYTAFLYGGSMISSLAGGGFLLRFGALRVSQACLVVVAVGLLINAPGLTALFVIGAVITGLGGGPSTPASSQILARYADPAQAPLIFSIKQTGVPVGGVIAGALLPVYVSLFGWRGAIVCAALMALTLALMLQPLRAEFDSDRQPQRSLKLTDIRATMTAVLSDKRVRDLAMGLFAFTGLQLAFASFFVSFLSLGLGWSLTDAGIAYSIAMGAGIVGRLIWGWVGTKYVSPLLLLAILGFVMGFAHMAIGLVTSEWQTAAVWAVAFAYGLTGIGYQGVLLAEIARVAPPGMAGVITGGAVFFAYVGMILLPATFGLILAVMDSYRLAFFILGVIPIVVAVKLLQSALKQTR